MTFEELEKVNSEITYTDVKGKDYAEVPQRVQAFRKIFPEGTIETEIVFFESPMIIIKATVKDGEKILGTGLAYEKEGNGYINKTSFVENCETSAVGRALGFIGIGSANSIRSAEEVENAALQQEEMKPINATKVKALEKRCKDEGVDVDKLLALYKVSDLENLNEKQHSNILNNWKKVVDACGLQGN